MPVASLYRHPLSDSPKLEEELNGTHVLRGYVNSMHGTERAFEYGLYPPVSTSPAARKS